LECYQKSLDIFESLEDPRGAASVLGNLGTFYYRRGARSLALEHFRRGKGILERLGDRQGVAEMQANIDMVLASQGDILASVSDHKRQLQELVASGDLSGQAEVLGAIAGCYADRFEWNLALSSYEESLSLFEQTGDVYCQAQTMFNIALVHKDRGDLVQAAQTFIKSLKIFQNLDAVPCIALTKMNLATILEMSGQLTEAEERLREALNALEALGAMPDLCEGYLAMGRFKLRTGHCIEAKFYLSLAETLIFRTDYTPMKIQLFRAQGELHQAEKRHREAESCYEKALAQARRLSNSLEVARCLEHLGRLAMEKKDFCDSLARLQQALTSFQRLGAACDVIAVYHDLITLFLAQDDHTRAEEMAVLLERQAELLGYQGPLIKATVDCKEYIDQTCEAQEELVVLNHSHI